MADFATFAENNLLTIVILFYSEHTLGHKRASATNLSFIGLANQIFFVAIYKVFFGFKITSLFIIFIIRIIFRENFHCKKSNKSNFIDFWHTTARSTCYSVKIDIDTGLCVNLHTFYEQQIDILLFDRTEVTLDDRASSSAVQKL